MGDARRFRLVASLIPIVLGGCRCAATGTHARFASLTGLVPAVAPCTPAPRAIDSVAHVDSVTQALFRNVNFHVAPGVALGIRRLRGEMVSRVPGQPVVFDDKRSFVIRIASAEVALDTLSLDHLMNDHVFAYRGAPLHRLRFGTRGDELVQRGVMHKVIDIPFTMNARVSVTPAGLLRLHPTSMKIGSLDGLGLMRAVGMTLGSLLDLHGARGVQVDGNDLLLDPLQVLPPPAITGRVTAVRVEPGRLVQIFGGATGSTGASSARTSAAVPQRLVPPDTTVPNYMYFRHGTLRFGKLTMTDADMQIVDLDPRTPFDFSIDRYNQQLVAGYSKNRPDLGLEVFMPDLNALQRTTAATPRVDRLRRTRRSRRSVQHVHLRARRRGA